MDIGPESCIVEHFGINLIYQELATTNVIHGIIRTHFIRKQFVHHFIQHPTRIWQPYSGIIGGIRV